MMQKGPASPLNRRTSSRTARGDAKTMSSPTAMTDHERLLQVFGPVSHKQPKPIVDRSVDGIEDSASISIQKAWRRYLARRSFVLCTESIVALQRWSKRIKHTQARSLDSKPPSRLNIKLPSRIMSVDEDDAPPEETTCSTIVEIQELSRGTKEDIFSKNSKQDDAELAKNDIWSASPAVNSDVSPTIRPNNTFFTQSNETKEGSCSSRQGKSEKKKGSDSAYTPLRQADDGVRENSSMPPQEHSDPNASFTNCEKEVGNPTLNNAELSDKLSIERDKTCDPLEGDHRYAGTPKFDFAGEEKKEEKEISESCNTGGSTTEQALVLTTKSEAPEMTAEAEVVSLEARQSTTDCDSSKVVARHDSQPSEPIETPAETSEELSPDNEGVPVITPDQKEGVNLDRQGTPQETRITSPGEKSPSESTEKRSLCLSPEEITAQTAKAVALKLAARRQSRSTQKPPKPSPKEQVPSDDEEDSISVQEEAILAQQQALAAKKSQGIKYGAASPTARLSTIMKQFESPLPNAPRLDKTPTTSYRATPPQRNRVRNVAADVSPMSPATPNYMYGNPMTPTPNALSQEKLKMEMIVVELQQEKLKSLEDKIALETKVMDLTLEVKRLRVKLEEAELDLQASEKKRMESDEAYVKLGTKMKKLDADAQSIAQHTHATMVTSGQQQALMQESGKMLEYLRKEVLKLRKENSALRADVSNLQDNAKRLVEANEAAEGNFATLTRHAKAEMKKLEFAAEEFKQEIKELKMAQAEQKDEIRMKQAAYVAEVHSRLQYQEAMGKIVDLLQSKCRDSRLVEQALQITDDVEDSDERLQSPSAKDDAPEDGLSDDEPQQQQQLNSSMVGRFTSFFS